MSQAHNVCERERERENLNSPLGGCHSRNIQDRGVKRAKQRGRENDDDIKLETY